MELLHATTHDNLRDFEVILSILHLLDPMRKDLTTTCTTKWTYQTTLPPLLLPQIIFGFQKSKKTLVLREKTQVVKSFKVIPRDYPIDIITDTGAAKMDAKTTSERKKY